MVTWQRFYTFMGSRAQVLVLRWTRSEKLFLTMQFSLRIFQLTQYKLKRCWTE